MPRTRRSQRTQANACSGFALTRPRPTTRPQRRRLRSTWVQLWTLQASRGGAAWKANNGKARKFNRNNNKHLICFKVGSLCQDYQVAVYPHPCFRVLVNFLAFPLLALSTPLLGGLSSATDEQGMFASMGFHERGASMGFHEAQGQGSFRYACFSDRRIPKCSANASGPRQGWH